MPQEGEISHSAAKELAPPGALLWRALSTGAWNGILPPFSEHSRSWRKYSERGALIEVLRLLWAEFADLKGLQLHELPIEGLFGSDGAQPSGGASSSAEARLPSSARAPARPAAKAAQPKSKGQAKGKATGPSRGVKRKP